MMNVMNVYRISVIVSLLCRTAEEKEDWIQARIHSSSHYVHYVILLLPAQ